MREGLLCPSSQDALTEYAHLLMAAAVALTSALLTLPSGWLSILLGTARAQAAHRLHLPSGSSGPPGAAPGVPGWPSLPTSPHDSPARGPWGPVPTVSRPPWWLSPCDRAMFPSPHTPWVIGPALPAHVCASSLPSAPACRCFPCSRPFLEPADSLPRICFLAGCPGRAPPPRPAPQPITWDASSCPLSSLWGLRSQPSAPFVLSAFTLLCEVTPCLPA